MELWKLIVESNTFNFVMMLVILIAVSYFAHLGEKLDQAVESVEATIDKSKDAKEASIKGLNDAQESCKNIQSEIKEIFEQGEKNAALLSEKIEKEAQKQVESIDKNTKKTIETHQKDAISALSKETIAESIELAKNHIMNMLQKNPKYHQVFIEESIEKIDRL